jgi:pimeloyl-ACP methyl ester carboxylesterase
LEVTTARVALPDGRTLDVAVAGPDDGMPLVVHHGSPGSALRFRPWIEAATARGLRYVSYSRPGYGASTRNAGRSVADCVADAARVADRIGAERFLTLGWSGGGPHALACAALIPERVLAAGTLAGVAPYDAEGLDWTAGMATENVSEFGAAAAGEHRLGPFLERARAELLAASGEDIARTLGGLVSEVDRDALTGTFAEFLAENMREALRSGIWGWLDDDLAFVRDWGFALDRLRVPVTIWQGADDRMVPFAHGRWLARHLSGARARLLPEHGHVSLVAGAFEMVLDELVASGRTAISSR